MLAVIQDLGLIILRAIIGVFAVIGGILYMNAYYKMKKTKIIGSVSILLWATAIDAIWYTYVMYLSRTIPEWIQPIFPSLTVKFILAASVVYFVVISITVDKDSKIVYIIPKDKK